MMATITLSNGKTVLVDDDLFTGLSAYKWNEAGNWYASTTVWLGENCMPRQKTIYMHRLVSGATETDQHVDHINRNKLDNRRSNLRVGTRAQNYVNQPPRGKLGVKGVVRNGNKYMAQMTVDGRHISLGYFETIEEAAMEYKVNAIKVWGEYAYTE